jgi:hypothetical protein
MSDMINNLVDVMVQRRATKKANYPEGERTEDVDLPMPRGGRRDPRLPKEQPDVLAAMGKAAGGYRSVRDSLAGMERARDRAANKK